MNLPTDAELKKAAENGMTDQELLRVCHAFRSGFIRKRALSSRGLCFVLSIALQGYLWAIGGVNTKLVEGRVRNSSWNHFWLSLEDGRIIDVTMDQFDYHRGTKAPKVYLGPLPEDYIIEGSR